MAVNKSPPDIRAAPIKPQQRGPTFSKMATAKTPAIHTSLTREMTRLKIVHTAITTDSPTERPNHSSFGFGRLEVLRPLDVKLTERREVVSQDDVKEEDVEEKKPRSN